MNCLFLFFNSIKIAILTSKKFFFPQQNSQGMAQKIRNAYFSRSRIFFSPEYPIFVHSKDLKSVHPYGHAWNRQTNSSSTQFSHYFLSRWGASLHAHDSSVNVTALRTVKQTFANFVDYIKNNANLHFVSLYPYRLFFLFSFANIRLKETTRNVLI